MKQTPQQLRDDDRRLCNKGQQGVNDSIERLSHFSLHALKTHNKGLCLACTDAIDFIINKYGKQKHLLDPIAFSVSAATRLSADFTSLPTVVS